MKAISTALQAHLQQEVTTLATCWRLTRRDGVIYGFTDHDQPLTIDGLTYEAATGFTPTAVETRTGLSVDNLDIDGMLTSQRITEADIFAGLYDFAEVSVFAVNYADLSQGSLPLRHGWLGEIRSTGERFSAEIRGLSQKLSHEVGSLFSPTCRAELGDSACGVDLTARTVTGTLTGVESASILHDSNRQETAGVYSFGVFTMTSGAASGLSAEVKSYQPGRLTLSLPLPYLPAVGESYELIEGCDKHFSTCKERFSNAVNFRGEPHVPGMDRLLETATTRRS